MSNSYFARPYDTNKSGFYFSDFGDYTTKAALSGAEEFEFQYIDGDLGYLFNVCKIDQATLEFWFDSIESLDVDNQAKLYFLVSECGVKLVYAIDQLDDIMIQECTLLEAATEWFDEIYLNDIPDAVKGYIDYESFARDMQLSGDMSEFDYQGKTYTCTNSNSI